LTHLKLLYFCNTRSKANSNENKILLYFCNTRSKANSNENKI